MTKKPASRTTPGPKPDVLKVNGDWEAAVGKALTKKRPKSGWPKPKKKKDAKK